MQLRAWNEANRSVVALIALKYGASAVLSHLDQRPISNHIPTL
ncbi:hypothetical protein [Ruegeria arenilitoris]|nr:hypothetical protein [Ruegeria arenilitoris]